MIGNLLRQLVGAIGKLLLALATALIHLINRFVPWHRLPTWVAVFNLYVFREDLRAHNLHDTSKLPGDPPQDDPPARPDHRYARTAEGTHNDLGVPRMGAAGTRFGRNASLEAVWPDQDRLLTPNPREVANTLLARDAFQPASILNVLAAAWIQFQNHEWFNHKRDAKRFIQVPIPEGDQWPESSMRIERTLADSTRGEGSENFPPTFLSEETHWWDGSQIYGSVAKHEEALREGTDGKLRVETVDGQPRLPEDPQLPGVDLTGFNQNYWVGLGLLHTLFVLEHNAICDALRRDYPTWSDERLFSTARLINAALMAKIHTVEWTPAILQHPALQIAMRANWWGVVGEKLTNTLGRLSTNEAISGIPGSPVDHHTAPYYLTEEFVSVYRLHPLIPDDYQFFQHVNGKALGGEFAEADFTAIQGQQTRRVMDAIPMDDLFYSLGIANPGAVVLHNFPRTLRNFQRPDGFVLDLAAVDITRDRERGVPRYNDFRQMLRMGRVSSFEEITDNRRWVQEMRELYNNDVNSLDLMVGMYAETPPAGFGFSDTAFRIFILMASRRLKSDRFFTVDFKPEVYTPLGMDWVARNGFKSVLQRHFPTLTPAFQDVANPFAPWRPVA